MITLTTSYQNNPLVLIQQEKHRSVLDWDVYPVKIPEFLSDPISRDIDVVLPILRNASLTPSKMAGIEGDCDPVIDTIDKEFSNAIRIYQNDLILAEGYDMRKISNLEDTYKIKSYGGWFGWIWQVLEKCGCDYRSKEYVNQLGSAHRIKWLMATVGKEEERIKGVKTKLSQRIKILVANLKALEEMDQTDNKMLKQLKQLQAVFDVLFPSEIPALEIEEAGQYNRFIQMKVGALV